MEYTFGNEIKDGPTILGLHAKKSFISVVSADDCRLVPEDFNTVLKATLDYVNDRGYAHYHKKTHKGLMRSLIVRRGVRTGELLINIITSSDLSFDESGYVDKIMSTNLDHELVGILHTINDTRSQVQSRRVFFLPDQCRSSRKALQRCHIAYRRAGREDCL